VGSAFQAAINDPAGEAGITSFVEAEMVWSCAGVVDAAVGDIDGKTGSGELRLRKTFASQPGEVSRPAGPNAERLPATIWS
jgi:hypothetical protein